VSDVVRTGQADGQGDAFRAEPAHWQAALRDGQAWLRHAAHAANGALGVLVFMRPLCFSTSAFAGVRMLKEAVGESQGSVPDFPVVLRERPPVGILIRSAS